MDHDKYTLAGMVGDELAVCAKFEAAIRLFFIAGQLEKALRLLCSLLTQVVHQPGRQGSMREQLSAMVERMNLALGRRKLNVDEHVVAAYQLLAQLLKFFDFYHAGESRLAAEVLAKHRIIPSSCNEVDNCVASIKQVGSDIVKVLPDVLLAAMDLIHAEYQELKTGVAVSNSSAGVSFRNSIADKITAGAENKDELLMQLRQRAKALTNMAATLPYRMPADTSNRLVQLEILMH